MTSGSREAIPPGIDISRPHSARMYDYFLGGKDNFAIDREAAEAALQSLPTLRTGVRENRRFLARAVKYLAGEGGIRQFLDIGTGLPGAGNTHEIAQAIAPDSRIVYADNDRCNSGCADVAMLVVSSILARPGGGVASLCGRGRVARCGFTVWSLWPWKTCRPAK
jgi:hypothetical protein